MNENQVHDKTQPDTASDAMNVGLPVDGISVITDAERFKTINSFLQIARERLDCLKAYEYVEDCDALELLDVSLDGAIAACGVE